MRNAYRRGMVSIGPLQTSVIEIREISKAWLAITLAFGIVMAGGFELSNGFFEVLSIAAITVGLGFIAHELSHKVVAQHYGCRAEFRAFNEMLILAILMSFAGFVFAAPGAVMIHGPVGRRRNGMISSAGPFANIVLALLFMVVAFLPLGEFMASVGAFGVYINSFLALFNMIPFGNFDGKKILYWNKAVYGVMVVVSLGMMAGANMLFGGIF